MIVGMEGTIELKEPTRLHLNVNGVIYEINISLFTSSSISERRVKLLITQIIREDANMLYGFLDKNEKLMFDTLIKISGIGAKVAMATCSTYPPATFSKIVAEKNVNMLKKVAGIGVKSASRILVELAGFIVDVGEDSKSVQDAILALESLGFKREQIKKALAGASGDTASMVKYALKRL